MHRTVDPPQDPAEFLRRHPPFDGLAPSEFRRVESTVEIVYVPRGTIVLGRSDPANTFLFVIRQGAVRLEADGRTIDLLEEGEPFGFPSLISGGPPHFDAVADEDCLLYRIPGATFDHLMEHKPFSEYFLTGLRERLHDAVTSTAPVVSSDLTVPAASLIERAPVFVGPSASVREAAQLMAQHRVSSVLVQASPLGIVTDRDLRSRVLARGLPPETLVRDVMSQPVATISSSASVFEALVLMLEHRIHHVPIVRDGEVLGVVTDTDLLRHHMQSPFHLLKGIERADDDDLAQGYGDRLAGLVESMVSAGVEAAQIGRVVATLNDTLVGRLLHRATAALGSPPCQFAWIVFGSEGRREQALLTDQDNAIVFADDTAEAREYFAALAKAIHDGLLAASFPPCAGGFMAINWCKPLAEWESLFHDWVENPRPDALIDACNFFDFRPVYGQLDLSRLDAIVHDAGRRDLFLGHMARVGVQFRPPLGLFRTIREEEGGVNVKKGGLMPIVAMARIYAIESRSRVRSTLSRLAAAATTGSVSGEGAATLGDAFRFLFQLRLSHQLAQRRSGDPVSNLVPLQRLNPLEARHLKSSFQLIRQMQEALASKYTVDLLG